MKLRVTSFASLALLLVFGLFFVDLVRRGADSEGQPTAKGFGVVSVVQPSTPSDADEAKTATPTISGTVLDGFKLPLANASVRVIRAGEESGRSTNTAKNGSFRFELNGSGTFSILVTSELWGEIEIVDIVVGEKVVKGTAAPNVELLLQYEGRSTLEGRVLCESPEDRNFTKLWLVGPHREVSRIPPLRLPLKIDEDGNFGWEGLSPGDYDVEGTRKGQAVGQSFVIRRNGEQVEVDVDLENELVTQVWGRAFLDDIDTPLSDERLFVTLSTDRSQAQVTVTTGSDGAFEFDSDRLHAGTSLRFFRDQSTAKFVAIPFGSKKPPYDVVFESKKGRIGMLVTSNDEEIPFADFTLRSQDRDKLYYFRSTDEAGVFPADDLVPGYYKLRMTVGASETISTSVAIPKDAEELKFVLPVQEYFVLLVSNAQSEPIPRGFLYHVSAAGMDRDIWDILPFSESLNGVSGAVIERNEEDREPKEPLSGATVVGLPSEGTCTVEVLVTEYGWARIVFNLNDADRYVPIQLEPFREVDVVVSQIDGTPVKGASFKFAGFYENAPLMPGGGGRGFFASMPPNMFVVSADPASGKYRVKLAPGSQIEIELPGRSRVQAQADDLIRDGRIVIE